LGHLQRNKVGQVVGKVDLIHSLDSLRLATEINHVADSRDVVADVLVAINIASEENKYGIEPNELFNFMEQASVLPSICIKGLMTMGAFGLSALEKTKNLKKWLDYLKI